MKLTGIQWIPVSLFRHTIWQTQNETSWADERIEDEGYGMNNEWQTGQINRDVTRPQPHEAEAEAEATTHEAEAEATTHEAEAEAEATTHEAEAEAEAKTHL